MKVAHVGNRCPTSNATRLTVDDTAVRDDENTGHDNLFALLEQNSSFLLVTALANIRSSSSLDDSRGSYQDEL